MEKVDIGDITPGDRIKWRFPNVGSTPRPSSNTTKVVKVVGWGHSAYYDAPYVDFFGDDGNGMLQRAIALPFITHHNGRRVDRRYWAGRLPELDLLRQPTNSNESRSSGGVQQLRIPLTEEDALALKTNTRKGLDEMSDSHRAHIEKWEPHIEKLGAEHVWASANRFSERGGTGPVYAAIKRGSKDYAIVDYDTEKMTKAKVLEDGFESSKALMESFKEYRKKAKEERQANKPAKKKASSGSGKKKSSSSSKKKPAAKRKSPPKKK